MGTQRAPYPGGNGGGDHAAEGEDTDGKVADPMCGRFTLGATAADLAAQFELANVPDWMPRYNIAPTQEVLVVVQPSPQANREARLHR